MIVMKPIHELQEYEMNPRINNKSVDVIKRSIKLFGFRVPIVIDKDNIIVAGHTRFKACLELEIDTIPCIVANDLTEAQIKAYRIADNKLNELSEWDYTKLKDELKDISGVDFLGFGFTDEEFEQLKTDMDERADQLNEVSLLNYYTYEFDVLVAEDIEAKLKDVKKTFKDSIKREDNHNANSNALMYLLERALDD